jgi:hypothetical protein
MSRVPPQLNLPPFLSDILLGISPVIKDWNALPIISAQEVNPLYTFFDMRFHQIFIGEIQLFQA